MSRHWVNLFEVGNVENLRLAYRLVDIAGLDDGGREDGDLLPRQLNLLRTKMLFKENCPVALIHFEGRNLIAIPADRALCQLEYQLVPQVATITPRNEVVIPDRSRLSQADIRFRDEVLRFALASPLRGREDIWSSSGQFFPKSPLNGTNSQRDIDIFEGFSCRICEVNDRLYLAIRLVHKYVEAGWLIDRHNDGTLQDFKMRHALYHFGHRWFPIQLLDFPQRAIKDSKFVAVDGSTQNVFDYTRSKCGPNPPAWVQGLDPRSPTVRYRYPGNKKESYGAIALVKLILRTSDRGTKETHALSIIAPQERFRKTGEVVQKYFATIDVAGTQLKISPRPLEVDSRRFAVPSLRFGQNSLLSVGSRNTETSVTLDRLGRERMQRLVDPRGGLAVISVLGPQFLIVPKSLDRGIVEDFGDQLGEVVRQFTKNPYSMQQVIYDDVGRTTLKTQVEAIVGTIQRSAAANGGHGLLVLPDAAKPDLHNYIKRKLQSTLQVQCVLAPTLKGFYQLRGNGGGAARCCVRRELEGRYTSMLRYSALGLLIANRQWPWVLEASTHYDAYVGLDVLNGTAAFTFFRDGGRVCFVRTEASRQKERLLRSQIRTVVAGACREHFCVNRPVLQSIVLRRDGRLFQSEWAGFQDAMRDLECDGVVAKEVLLGAVEVQKSNASGLRLVEVTNGVAANPTVGAWFPISECEGLVCTTGEPFRLRGTVDPLHVHLARGALDLQRVLEDTFAMSQLCWPVPDRCMRLPIDLKLCDDFLRNIASDAKEEEAVYGEDPSSDTGEPDSGETLEVSAEAL